jgi:Uri superfamily endonuclease
LKGSYLLILTVGRRVRFKPGYLPKAELPPGCYVYIGSAKGPGGFEKRVLRHLKKSKRARWHIDYLTRLDEVRVEGVFYISPKHNEPALTAFLSSLGLRKIVRGFGATDYPGDFSHLLYSGEGLRETVRRIMSAMKNRRIAFKFFSKGSLRRFSNLVLNV